MKNLLFIAAIFSAAPAFANIFDLYQEPVRAADEGTSVRGGGNSVGNQLFDDYENEGVVRLQPKQIEALIAPVMANLKKKLPNKYGWYDNDHFITLLEAGITGMKWYLDPKPLKQYGGCVNKTVLELERVVRACQSKLAVRIDKEFFEQNPQVQVPMIMHELLVYIQIRNPGVIEDEGVREVNRAIRDYSLPQSELKETIKAAGFGEYSTAEEIAEAKAAEAKRIQYCAKIHKQGKKDRWNCFD